VDIKVDLFELRFW